MIKTVHGRDTQQKCMHQVAMIGNEAHRPLLFAKLVPGIFFDAQAQLAASILCLTKRHAEWRRVVNCVPLQIGGLYVPPPVAQREDRYHEYSGDAGGPEVGFGRTI